MKLYLFGYPLGHSVSPQIHQTFLNQLGLKGEYTLLSCDQEEFERQIDRLKQNQVDGFNITIPYKQEVIKFLDRLDPTAEAIGAVNTVVVEDGEWVGYNTDGLGYVQSLKEHFPELFKRKINVLVLGAGGASRGIIHAILKESIHRLTIANRSLSKAEEIVDLFAGSNQVTTLEASSYQEAEKKIETYDLIINTTSLGMVPNETSQAVQLDGIKKEAIVSDIVYKPLNTQLLKQAKSLGARVHHGHEMLIYQAKLAFEMWSQQTIDLEPIKKDLERKLFRN